MYRDTQVGNYLREGRINAGLSAEQAASMYGRIVNGTPITRKAYLKMEEGHLPKTLKRRAILAGMLGIAPVLLLPEAVNELPDEIMPTERSGKTLNLKEYRSKLLTAEKQGYPNPSEALRDTAARINALHNRVFYVSTQEQEEMKWLLCGYQIWRGDIAREQGSYQLALSHYNRAITLSHQEGFTDFEAAAICARGNLFLDEYKLKPALQDFQKAATFQTPDQLKGHILSLQALTQMRLAQTDTDKTEALHLIDETEKLAGPQVEDTLYLHSGMRSFPLGRYLRFRANTLMAAPVKKLRSSSQAAEILDSLEIQNRTGRYGEKRHSVYHQMECNLAYARIFRDQQYYPIALSLLQDTLKLTQEVNSKVHLLSVSNIHNDLRTTSFGKNNEDMAMLGVEITKIQFPSVFN